jgi:hypothetical protein
MLNGKYEIELNHISHPMLDHQICLSCVVGTQDIDITEKIFEQRNFDENLIIFRDEKQKIQERYHALDQIYESAEELPENWNDILEEISSKRSFLASMKRFNLFPPFLTRAKNDISSELKLEIIEMLTYNVFKADEINSICFDILSSDSENPKFWEFIITKYNQILTKATSVKSIDKNLSEILNFYQDNSASKIRSEFDSRGIDTEVFIPIVLIPKIQKLIKKSELEATLASPMKSRFDIYQPVENIEKNNWELFYELIDKELIFYAEGVAGCIQDKSEIIPKICDWMEKNDLGNIEKTAIVTKIGSGIIEKSQRDIYWKMVLKNMAKHSSHSVIRFVQDLRTNNILLPKKSLKYYRNHLHAQKLFDFEDNDLRNEFKQNL